MDYQQLIDMSKGAVLVGLIQVAFGMFLGAFGGERSRPMGSIIWVVGGLQVVMAVLTGALVLAMEMVL